MVNMKLTDTRWDDYKEFLELSRLFPGELTELSLRKPWALHQARWMAKMIYSLKIAIVATDRKAPGWLLN